MNTETNTNTETVTTTVTEALSKLQVQDKKIKKINFVIEYHLDSKYQDTECSICCGNLLLKNLNNDIIVGNCGHIFHEKCIKSWHDKQLNCPNCKVDWITKDTIN